MIPARRSIVAVAVLALLVLQSSFWAAPAGASGASRANYIEAQDDDAANNDDFTTAQEFANDTFLDGTTGLGDVHRIDIYVLKNVPAGSIINASLQITNFHTQPGQGQSLLLEGWNKLHMEHLAWSNREDQPVRRPWEAISFLCVVTGDYYISLKPIAGQGTTNYTLHVRSFEATDITSRVGTGGAFGKAIVGQVSSDKWYPLQWYRFQLTGENNGMNDFFYCNLTVPGAPDQRLLADLYVRNLEPETFTYWLNHSWWLDSFVQYEEVHAAACGPGLRWYYLTVQAYNSSGGRSENFELRMTRTLIESDGDNSPRTATPVICSDGNLTVRKEGYLVRGPDMFDWYKVYLHKGDALRANLTLLEKSCSIFRLSAYWDNKNSPLPEPGYELLSSWTNKPAETLLNKISIQAANVGQEGWYYIGVIAQLGLVPYNISLVSDWTCQSPWSHYRLDITLPDHTSAPFVSNPLPGFSMDEDTVSPAIPLLDNGQNGGMFSDLDFSKEWGDGLVFSATSDPCLHVVIGSDPASNATVSVDGNWNGDAAVTFTATDRYGKQAQSKVAVHVLPTEDPPVVKALLPDFTVTELATNGTMTGIDLDACFSDPDLPPFGTDALTYSIDNGSFPAALTGSRLDFGEAPDYPGFENTTVSVTITATDQASKSVSDTLVITVIDREPGGSVQPKMPPVFDAGNASVSIAGGQSFVLDLNWLFYDPQGGPLEFAYLGGASPGLSVALEPNGTVRLTPAPDYVPAVENLLFQATDSSDESVTGTVKVTLKRLNSPPEFVPASLLPDPSTECRVAEGSPITFSFRATDADDAISSLSCVWSMDGAVIAGQAGWSFSWTPGYDRSGVHTVTAALTDGHSTVRADWRVKVVDVNRPPSITVSRPAADTVARPGVSVSFSASASDPDGDPLEFTWSLPDGTVLKRETGLSSTFSRVFRGGENVTILLRVSDGNGGEDGRSFNVVAPAAAVFRDEPTMDNSPLAYFALVMIMVGLAGGVAAIRYLRGRR